MTSGAKKLIFAAVILLVGISLSVFTRGSSYGAARNSPGGGSPISPGLWTLDSSGAITPTAGQNVTVGTITVSNCIGCAGGSLSGGIAGSVAVWGSASTLGATSTLTYSTSTGLFSNKSGITSSTNMVVDSSLTVQGQNVCLANGTNCLANTVQNLQSVTTQGATSTASINLYGSLTAGGAFVATSTSAFMGTNNLYATTTIGGYLTATSTLSFMNGFVSNRNQIDASTYTATSGDFYLAVSTTNQAVALSLPSATSVGGGFTLRIKDRNGNASSKAITITANGTNTIDATTTYIIGGNWNSINLISDGSSRWETY